VNWPENEYVLMVSRQRGDSESWAGPGNEATRLSHNK